MTRRVALSAVLFLVFSLPLFAGGFSQSQDFRPATAAELAMKSAPGDPGAEAAILDWVRVDDDPTSTSSDYVRMKIFTEDGKKHADVELAYYPAYPVSGRITDISARTIRPDGTVVPFDGKVFDKVLYKSGRSALRAKTFTLADVQPGSIIEYRYIRRWANSLLMDTYWPVQRDIPIVHAKLTLTPYDSKGEYGSFFTFVLPPGVAPVRQGKSFELELRDMPALRKEEFMPPLEQVRARVNFVYTASRVPPDQFWNAQAHAFATDIEKFIRSKKAQSIASGLTANITARRAALEKLYAHAQSLRNISFESEKTAQEQKRDDLTRNRGVDDVLTKGGGTSDEVTRAFVALARGAGFDAYSVRVAPRDEVFFSDKIPDADQMSEEVALVMLDGKPLYLDPGTPHAPFGIVAWQKSNTISIQADKGGKPVWGRSARQEPAQALTRRKAELKLEGDTLEGRVTVTFAGQEALLRRLDTLNDDAAARTKALEDEVRGWFPDGATVKLAEVKGFDTHDPELTAKFDVSLPNLVSSAGSRTIVPISIFAAKTKNPFTSATRVHAVYFPFPSREEDEIVLTMPEGLTLNTIPPKKTIDGGAVKYNTATSREGNTITFVRNATVDAMMVEVPHYGALRQVFSNMTSADQTPLVLERVAGK